MGCPSLNLAHGNPTRKQKNMQGSETPSTILRVSCILCKEIHKVSTRYEISLGKVVHKYQNAHAWVYANVAERCRIHSHNTAEAAAQTVLPMLPWKIHLPSRRSRSPVGLGDASRLCIPTVKLLQKSTLNQQKTCPQNPKNRPVVGRRHSTTHTTNGQPGDHAAATRK